MPQWLTDAGTISSIIGLIVTLFLLLEARKIQLSFLRRARLPALTKELNKSIPKISRSLGSWKTDDVKTKQEFAKVKALLENLKPKLTADEKKHINSFLVKLQPRKYYIIRTSIFDLTEDLAWDLYTDLNLIATGLDQLIKDSKWDRS